MIEEPKLNVGILTGEKIDFIFQTPYHHAATKISGPQEAICQENRIFWNGQLWDELLFTPLNKEDTFELPKVTIGINFHWERTESQRFKGALRIVASKGQLIAINNVLVEDYLTSVISSEMSAKANDALLMAHTIIARSWLLVQIRKEQTTKISPPPQTESERIMWYDRDDHTLFDVCADDHCQRYQGVTRTSTESALRAVATTRGETLMFDDKICDTRYSKCCGGMMEEFKTCWGDEKHPYLVARLDRDEQENPPDLTQPKQAEEWIREE